MGCSLTNLYLLIYHSYTIGLGKEVVVTFNERFKGINTLKQNNKAKKPGTKGPSRVPASLRFALTVSRRTNCTQVFHTFTLFALKPQPLTCFGFWRLLTSWSPVHFAFTSLRPLFLAASLVLTFSFSLRLSLWLIMQEEIDPRSRREF